MKYILQNYGNMERFNSCAKRNIAVGSLVASMTVNCWYNPRRTVFQCQYDAAFHVTQFKKLGKDCRKLGAVFKDDVFQKGVLYRIRVWPKVIIPKPWIGCSRKT